MKKLFTLLAGALVIAGNAFAADVTISWTTANNQLVPTITGAETGIEAQNLTLNDPNFLRINGTQQKTSVTLLRVGSKAAYDWRTNTPAEGQSWVKCPVIVSEGYTFKVTEVSFYAGKCGSDGMTLNAFYYLPNSSLQKVTLGNSLVLKRADRTGVEPDKFTYTAETEGCKLNQAESFTGESALVFNLKGTASLSETKYWGFGNIVVKGELLSDEEAGDTRQPAPISWSSNAISYKVRTTTYPELPVLNNTENLPVNYSSSNTDIAEIDANGVVTLKNTTVGNATITAIYDGNETYKNGSWSYSVEVITNEVSDNAKDPSFVEGKIDVMTAMWYVPEGLNLTEVKDSKGKVTTTFEAGTIWEDEAILVTNPYPSKLGGKAAKYLGYEFANSIDVRAEKDPTAELVEGAKRANATSLIITPAQDLELVIFGLRQTTATGKKETVDDVENNIIYNYTFMGYTTNDGKSVYVVDQADVKTKLIPENVFGNFQDASYCNMAAIFKLQKDHTYTVWSRGTTYNVQGLGYILTLSDPWHSNGVTLEGTPVEHVYTDGEQVLLNHALGKDVIYYTLDGNVPNPANVEAVAPAAAPARAAAVDAEDHTGKTYKLTERPIVYNGQALNISYLAHKEGYKPSAVQTLDIFEGGTTGIESIGADAQDAPVEYFNLQGVRVENPSNGIFIRRQGNTVTKVVVK